MTSPLDKVRQSKARYIYLYNTPKDSTYLPTLPRRYLLALANSASGYSASETEKTEKASEVEIVRIKYCCRLRIRIYFI